MKKRMHCVTQHSCYRLPNGSVSCNAQKFLFLADDDQQAAKHVRVTTIVQ